MNKNALQSVFLALVFAVSVLFVPTSAPTAHAALISNEQFEEQKRQVLLAIVDVLREDVRYLQMALILKLERQVQELQARVGT